MKIIKKGILPEEKTYEVTCNNCQTVFSFEMPEAEYTPGDYRDGSFLTIKCPLCEKKVFQYIE